jgi:CubicO group peptidase (beta-lactamase class C family)
MTPHVSLRSSCACCPRRKSCAAHRQSRPSRRQRFHYNNVHYLAAGRAAATAAGASWDALVSTRILHPLGMRDTRTSMRETWKDPRMARSYLWDEARNEHGMDQVLRHSKPRCRRAPRGLEIVR